jgi:hypothetical protein
MTTYISPTSGKLLPDIIGGQLTQTNGNPPTPATTLTGPVVNGPIWSSDGTGSLAGVGETSVGTANAGYAVTVQGCVITQATNDGTTGQFACPIVIPAQSQILRINLMVTTAWTGTTTLGIGSGASATAFTTAAEVSGATLGLVAVTCGANATQIGNWDNVSTGSGVGTLTVEYIPMINQAS